MKTNPILRDRDLPEYVSGSIGKPDLDCIANRIRELASYLSAHEYEDVAAHLAEAYGALLGRMAAHGAGVSAPNV